MISSIMELTFFQFPLVSQLALIGVALCSLLGIKKTDPLRISLFIMPLLIFLALKDIFYLFFPSSLFLIMAGAIAWLFIVLIFFLNIKNTFSVFLTALVGALLIGIPIVYFTLPALPFIPKIIALLTPCILFLLVFSKDSIHKDRVLSLFGLASLGVFLFLPPIFVFFSESALFYSFIVVPISYIALNLGLTSYWRGLQDNLIKDRDYQVETIDSLYGFVSRATDTISSGADIQSLMDYVALTLSAETNADGAAIFILDDFEDELRCHAIYGEPDPLFNLPEDIPRDRESVNRWLSKLMLPLSAPLVSEILQKGAPFFIPNCAENPILILDTEITAGSAIISPFVIKDRVIGMSILTRHNTSKPFQDENFDKAALLADFASLVINNVFSFQDVTEKTDINTSTGIAADIQQKLSPKKIIDSKNASFGFFSKPARGVYGDYFDVIKARKDKIYLVMCDVAGKGIQASMVMVMIRAILYLVTNTNQNASTILNWVNRGITGKVDIDHFATLQVLIYNPLTGECEYANAGHRPPLLWKDRDGIVDAIELSSVPIGVERLYDYKSTNFTLENNDILLLYTDGVVETMNGAGRQYGIRALTTMLHKNHDLPVNELVSKISREIKDFAGSIRQHDDQTLLAMKINR